MSSVRRRTDADIPAVVDLLLRQQPLTGYPLRRPLPMPPEQFVARGNELASWVAVADDGAICGHVAVGRVDPAEPRALWSEGSGRPVEELAKVGVLVVDPAHAGRGHARRLLDAAEAWLRRHGRQPVLEVLGRAEPALRLYESRGWRRIGTTREPWLPDDEPDVVLMVLSG